MLCMMLNTMRQKEKAKGKQVQASPLSNPMCVENCVLIKQFSYRSKITFIAWSPDDAPLMPKMMYSSSKDALKRSLNGIAAELQANDEDDIEWDSLINRVSKR